eukprot:3941960-Rhodomonas_salina.6
MAAGNATQPPQETAARAVETSAPALTKCLSAHACVQPCLFADTDTRDRNTEPARQRESERVRQTQPSLTSQSLICLPPPQKTQQKTLVSTGHGPNATEGLSQYGGTRTRR